MTIRNFSCAQFFQFGLEVVGFDVGRQRRTCMATNMERFRAAFGVGPGVCAAVFRDLQTTEIPSARVDKPNSFYFLVALNWLAICNKEMVMAGFFKTDEKTLREHIKTCVDSIAALKEQKIVWKDLDDVDETFVMSVDGVHFRINEPRKQPSANWCSHKSKSAGLGYEIGMSIWHNQVVWIAGPFQAAAHDKTKYEEEGGLQSRIPDGKLLVGDRGCRGENFEGRQCRSLSIRNTRDSEEVKEFKRRVRARHENFNARMKSFAMLENRFRHGLTRHQAVFEAVCVLCQCDMENGHPLFDV